MRTAPPTGPGQPGDNRPTERPPEPERNRQARHDPEHESGVDELDDRVLQQIGGEARLRAALGVDEEPPQVRVEEAAQGAAPSGPVPDVGLCGSPSSSEKAWCLRWSATHEITGPSIAAEPSAAKIARTGALVLKLRCVNRRWNPTVIPRPVTA